MGNMDIKLNLNDFKAVLGKQNDGDVKVNDKGDLVKVNFGGKIMSLFRKKEPLSPEMNRQLRQAFMSAIENSREGKVMTRQAIEEIRMQLGLAGDAEGVNPEAALTRHDIDSILSRVQNKTVAMGQTKAIFKQDARDLNARGIYNKALANEVVNYMNSTKCLVSVKDMVDAAEDYLPRGKSWGFPKSDLIKMIKNNAAQLRELAFLRLYMQAWNARANGVTFAAMEKHNPESILFANVRDLMTLFAKHMEGHCAIEGLPPKLPGTAESQNAILNNPQLTAFTDKLAAVDALIDKLFPKVAEPLEEGANLSLEALSKNRFNEGIKFALREQLSTAMDVNQNDAAATLKSDGLKPFLGLLKLPAGFADTLEGEQLTALQSKFQKILSAYSYTDAQEAPLKALTHLADAFKPISQEIGEDAQLADAFKDSGIDASKFEALKDGLKQDGVLDPHCKQACEIIQNARLQAAIAKFLDPSSEVELPQNAKDAKKMLTEAFRAAQERLNETGEERAKLILNYSPGENKDIYFSYVNDDAPLHTAMRSKLALVKDVFGFEALEEMGIPLDKRTKVIQFNCVGERPHITDYEDLTDAQKKGIDKELEGYLKIMDGMIEHVTAHEIKARQLYSSTNANVLEGAIFSEDEHPILDAMRDDLIPNDTSYDAFLAFQTMFYRGVKGDPVKESMVNGITLQLPNESNTSLKTEFETCIACMKRTKQPKAEQFENDVKNKLATIEKTVYANPEEKKAAIRACYMDYVGISGKLHDFLDVKGFGTTDIKSIFNMLHACGIDIRKFSQEATRDQNGKIIPPDFDRTIALMDLIAMRHGKTDGIVEWFERISGRPITELSREMVQGLAYDGKINDDPLDKLANNSAEMNVSKFLKGEYSLEQSGIRNDERVTLAKGLRQLVRRQNGDLNAPSSVQVTIGGVGVELSINAELRKLVGAITVKGQRLPIAFPQDLGDLQVSVENGILENLETYRQNPDSQQMILELLPDTESATQNVSRSREIYTRVLVQCTGKSAVNFSSLKIEELRALAVDLIRGNKDPNEVNPPVVTSYNSQESIELGAALLKDPVTLNKISWTSEVENLPPPETREGKKPADGTIRDLAADLVMNKNTWTFDTQSNLAAGERILKVLKGYAPEVRYILNNPESLNVLSGAVKDSIAAILEQVRGLDENITQQGVLEGLNPASPEIKTKLEGIDNAVNASITATMNDLQKMVSKLFVGQNGNEKDIWKMSAGELNGTGGLDTTTPYGEFVKNVLDNYFKGASDVDKRAMFAAYIRNTTPEDSDGKQAGELIKGAGPLLQKMLQGLPVETFPPETQAALQDTRSNLAPIPAEVVNARLVNMIKNANGFITKIDVKKSLGAASVGQAFLCTIYTKERPYTGEDVVIKILRPNVETAARREYELIMNVARAQNKGMDKVFDARYANILQEFDFTLEANNVDRGSVYEHAKVGRNESKDVRSMGRYPSVRPTTGALVLQKIDGKPYSSFVRDTRTKMKAILAPFRKERALELGGEVKVTYELSENPVQVLQMRAELSLLHDDLWRRRKSLENLSQAWFQQAFEGGFIHGDMHSGNIMTGPNGATVIDFGNAMFLSEQGRKSILVSLAACMFGELTDKDNPGKNIIECMKSMSKDKALAARYEEAKADKALLAELKTVLLRGAKADVVTRLLSALTLMQKHNYPIPEEMTVFTQSLSRLQAAMSETDDMLAELKELSDELEMTDELKAKFADTTGPLTKQDGGFQLFRDIDKAILTIATTKGPLPQEDTDFAQNIARGLDKDYGENNTSKHLAKHRAAVLAQLKQENPEFLMRNNGIDFMEAVIAKYGKLQCATVHADGKKGRSIFVKNVLDEGFMRLYDEYKAQVQKGETSQEELDKAREKVQLRFITCVLEYTLEFRSVTTDIQMNLHEPPKVKTEVNQKGKEVETREYQIYQKTKLKTFEECGYKALSTVLGLYIKSDSKAGKLKEANALFGSAMPSGGVLFGTSLAAHMEGFMDHDEEMASEVEDIRASASDASKPDTYIDRHTRRVLEDAAKNFLMPSTGLTDANKAEVARTNLEVLRKSLGRVNLTEKEIAYFAKLVEAYQWTSTTINVALLLLGRTDSYHSPFEVLKGDPEGIESFIATLQNEQLAFQGQNNIEAE